MLEPCRHMLSQHPHLHPLEWVPRVTKVTNNTDKAKTTKNRTNCTSARPTPLHTNPMEPGPENTFSAQNRKKNQKFAKGGGNTLHKSRLGM